MNEKNPMLAEKDFLEELQVAFKGLEHKHNWKLNMVCNKTVDDIPLTIFFVAEIDKPIAVPFPDLALLLHECFYQPNKTLCDELNEMFLMAKKNMDEGYFNEDESEEIEPDEDNLDENIDS